jgi:ABC-2 type transport system ATP-binding protein
LGPNGGGKTTLLRLLSTYASPSSGQVHWAEGDGSELRDPAAIRARIGYAGHAPLLWDELTVEENIALQLRLRRRPASEAEPWMRRFSLEGTAQERTDSLSRGMRQRVSLAQAFAHAPDFLLLDEPLSNLDDGSASALLEALAQVRGKATVVVATHQADPFLSSADHVLQVGGGAIRPAEGAA